MTITVEQLDRWARALERSASHIVLPHGNCACGDRHTGSDVEHLEEAEDLQQTAAEIRQAYLGAIRAEAGR